MQCTVFPPIECSHAKNGGATYNRDATYFLDFCTIDSQTCNCTHRIYEESCSGIFSSSGRRALKRNMMTVRIERATYNQGNTVGVQPYEEYLNLFCCNENNLGRILVVINALCCSKVCMGL